MTTESRAIALLIDGDNAQYSLIEGVLAEVAKYGRVTTRRIYGDWTTQNMSGWKAHLHKFALQPIQQFRNTTGKNATDSALIIDAMDLLHSGTVQGFCIVSSDSDFTRLATRIREQGLFVMGVGRRQTPESLINACEIFVYEEILKSQSTPEKIQTDGADSKGLEGWESLVTRALEEKTQEDGWAFLGAVGNYVRELNPDFDPRNHDQRQLSQLLRTREDLFELREHETAGDATLIYARIRR